MANDELNGFLPAVRDWFRAAYGRPTPPQAQGWPAIQRGEHTLIFAPTGSGKTLTAFLWGIDQIMRERQAEPPAQNARRPRAPSPDDGVRLLYVSPLKALNNDIERNLRVPLEGIRETAARDGTPLPIVRVAVRTGDTPSSARAQMVKRPPDILITTPESLYLMLTSPRAREMFRSIRTVIVDEIHALVGDKRGVHLSLSLERLAHLAGRDVQRLGLSATIRPLEEGARFLAGRAEWDGAWHDRPVTIVNAAYDKQIDVQVVTPVADLTSIAGGTIWPHVIPRVLSDVLTHRTSLIFANNRRLAERTADRLNAQWTAAQTEEGDPLSPQVLAPNGVPRDSGMWAIGAEGPFRAHHGSMSKEARREMESDLKAGRLPALIGTSSLELGIDIGSIDLVVQLQSPKSVAQGLQRIGRSGHLVGQTSHGRIYATHAEDLVEAAAVTRGMLDRVVEETHTPQNPLDVLAQQIVAMVAAEPWDAGDLYAVVRCAHAYRDLSREAFDLVLGMLSGKYDDAAHHAAALRAKLVWDRANDRLTALPGTRLLAMSNAGTIGDKGAFGVYLGDGKTKLGELDEEFVYETRPGNTFLLGSQVWRVLDIQNDRIVVGEAAGATPRMPFWRGDYPWRSYDLGVRIGALRREVAQRMQHDEDVIPWLRSEFRLDEFSAANLLAHVRGQVEATGAVCTDRTLVVESFEDAIGARNVVVQTPFGGRINSAWALALASRAREQLGIEVETQVNDDGIMLRLPAGTRRLPPDFVRIPAGEARERIVRELPYSALFGAHFRVNAERALLLPKSRGRKRTPFWLQRLKAKDLLAATRQFDDFPIVAETYRDCLRDVLDMPHLAQVLDQIEAGVIEIVPVETLNPSAIARGLLFAFQAVYQYEWDEPKAERDLRALLVREEVLDDLLAARGGDLSGLLRPAAINEVRERAQHAEAGYRARSAAELGLLIYELGDLSTGEALARSEAGGADWLRELETAGTIRALEVPSADGREPRWVHAERAEQYRAAFAAMPDDTATREIVLRFVRHAGPIAATAIAARYAFAGGLLAMTLDALLAAGDLVRGRFTAGATDDEYISPHVLKQVHQRTLTILRREVQAVPFEAYADFLARWQGVHPETRRGGDGAVQSALAQLAGAPLHAAVWEREILASRLDEPDVDALAEALEREYIWVLNGSDARHARIRVFARGDGALFVGPPVEPGDGAARQVLEFVKGEGTAFTRDIERGTGLAASTVQKALAGLVFSSLVTNDALDTLRAVLAFEPDARERAPLSSLESELAARLQSPRLTSTRLRAAKKRVRARLEQGETAAGAEWPGRWSSVHRFAVMGKPASDGEKAERTARILLQRYGVLMRELLEREELALGWDALYGPLQRMEMRGEVRRGYFVADMSGAQFALPEAVEQLRAMHANDSALIVLNATDPANRYGAGTADTPRFALVPINHVVMSGGAAILVAEDHGGRIYGHTDARDDLVQRALGVYLARPNAERHVEVREWNGQPVPDSPMESVLRTLGFNRTPKGMER
ncbi:MAG: DEAD/DEAH box helicase [Chloroflexi bacterium]|nr:DEAD/DEAH box helicase [Chloroflexota bacterium]